MTDLSASSINRTRAVVDVGSPICLLAYPLRIPPLAPFAYFRVAMFAGGMCVPLRVKRGPCSHISPGSTAPLRMHAWKRHTEGQMFRFCSCYSPSTWTAVRARQQPTIAQVAGCIV